METQGKENEYKNWSTALNIQLIDWQIRAAIAETKEKKLIIVDIF